MHYYTDVGRDFEKALCVDKLTIDVKFVQMEAVVEPTALGVHTSIVEVTERSFKINARYVNQHASLRNICTLENPYAAPSSFLWLYSIR